MIQSNANGKLGMSLKNYAGKKQGQSVLNLKKLLEKRKGIKL